MSDRRLRELERRIEQDPSDQDALTQAIAARQRSGLPVPGKWLVSQVFSPRRFAYPEPASISVLAPDGRRQTVGTTPAITVHPDGRDRPPHLRPWRDAKSLSSQWPHRPRTLETTDDQVRFSDRRPA